MAALVSWQPILQKPATAIIATIRTIEVPTEPTRATAAPPTRNAIGSTRKKPKRSASMPMLITPTRPPNWKLEAMRKAWSCGTPVVSTKVGSQLLSRLSTVRLRKKMTHRMSVIATRLSVNSWTGRSFVTQRANAVVTRFSARSWNRRTPGLLLARIDELRIGRKFQRRIDAAQGGGDTRAGAGPQRQQ